MAAIPLSTTQEHDQSDTEDEHLYTIPNSERDPIAFLIMKLADIEECSPLDFDPIGGTNVGSVLTLWPLDGDGENSLHLSLYGYEIVLWDDGRLRLNAT